MHIHTHTQHFIRFVSRNTCIYIYIYILIVGREFANGPRDRGSISRQVKPKTLKMVLDAALLNIQHYKVRTKGKVERCGTLTYTTEYHISLCNFVFSHYSIYLL